MSISPFAVSRVSSLPVSGLLLLWLAQALSAQVIAPTTITPTPAALTFSYQIGPAAKQPVAQSVSLKSNDANLVLSLAITGTLNGNWLEPSVRRGGSLTLPGSITLTATPTSLAAGTYVATVTLSGTDSHSRAVSQNIQVTLVVTAAASQLDFSPANGLTFTYWTGSTAPTSKPFVMYTEDSPLTATISVSGAAWLKVTPTGSVQVGGLFQPITVSIDPTELAKLAPKVYTANIMVAAPTAINKSTTYPITLNVNATPPMITGTWPAGLVATSAAGTTAVVIDGLNFFDTSKVDVTGFTTSSVVTVQDSAASPLSVSKTISIPVYPTVTPTYLHLTLASPLPSGFVGSAYSQDLHTFAAGGVAPYSWSVSGLAGSGLVIDVPTSGILHGATPVAGDYQAVLTVTDSNGQQAFMPLDLTIYPFATPPASTIWLTVPATNVLPAGTLSSAYSANLTVLAGATGVTPPFVWSELPALPGGLTLTPGGLNQSTGALGGSPNTLGPAGNLATIKKLSDAAIQVTIPNTDLNKLGLLRMTVTTPTPGGGTSNEAQLQVYGPEPRILAVGNAASYSSGTFAPGEIISIFGTGLGPAALAVSDPTSNPLPQALPVAPLDPTAITQVQFTNGTTTWTAPLLFTSAGQIACMIPFEVTGALSMTVSYWGLKSLPYALTMAPVAPGIFTADASGAGQGAILNYIAATGDYTVNSANTPAIMKGGADVVFYLTGFGLINPFTTGDSLLPAGAGVGLDPSMTLAVTIDGKAATLVQAVVPQGSFRGILQVRVTVPTTAIPGKAVPLTVSVDPGTGAVAAQTGVTLALK